MGRLGLAIALGLACIIGAAVAVVAMIAFGCLSLYLYMATVTTPALAALTVAGGALFLALFFLLLVAVIPRPSLLSLFVSESNAFGRLFGAIEMGQNLGDEGRQFLKSNLTGSAVAAFGFGIAMGISPKLRRAVFDMLRR